MRYVLLLTSLIITSLAAGMPTLAQNLTTEQEALLRAVLKKPAQDTADPTDIKTADDPAVEKEDVKPSGKEALAARVNFADLRPEAVAVKVQTVIDPITFLGSNGTLYRLSGLDVPGLETGGSDIVSQATKRTLELLKDQELKLYVTKDQMTGRQNRMGQSLVQAERKKDGLWIQGQLIADGLARVRTTPSNPEKAKDMLALEASARTQKKGLWANKDYAILTPETVTSKANNFAIVEGRVFSVASRNNETFLNFTNDWKKDFTIGVSSETRRQFSKAGVNFAALAHKNVRVHGFIEDRNGPFISLDHPEQLEILSATLPEISTPNAPGMKSTKAFNKPKAPEIEEPEAPEAPIISKPKAKAKMNE